MALIWFSLDRPVLFKVLVGRGKAASSTLKDDSPEKPVSQGRVHMERRCHGPGTLAHHGHQIRVTSEARNVFLNPLQGCHLVSGPHVAGHLLCAQGHEPQGAQPGQFEEEKVQQHLYRTVTTTTPWLRK